MAAPAPITRPTPDQLIVRERAVRLANGVYAPFVSVNRRITFGLLAAGLFGAVVGTWLRLPLVAVVVTIGTSLIVATLVWFRSTDERYWRALELIADHNCHERAEWKVETGKSMPRSMSAATRWLEMHPTAPGRASLLLIVGRLAEADEAIDAMVAKTPEDALAIEILRKTRVLFAGGRPDLTPLHESWGSLQDPGERRHRRECLPLLEAQIAVDAGLAPIPVMATARDDLQGVYWATRTPVLMAQAVILALVVAPLSGLLVAVLVDATARSL